MNRARLEQWREFNKITWGAKLRDGRGSFFFLGFAVGVVAGLLWSLAW